MSERCREIRALLAELGPSALGADFAARQHVESCERCCALLEAIDAAESGLRDLTPLDAPDALVERLLAHVSDAPTPQAEHDTTRDAQDAGSRNRARGRSRPGRSSLRVLLPTAAACALLLFSLRTAYMTWSEPGDPSARVYQMARTEEFAPESSLPSDKSELRSRVDENAAAARRLGKPDDVERDAVDGGTALGGLGRVAEPELARPAAPGIAGHASDPISADALSQLDFQDAQSQLQRANEAFGYFGLAELGGEAVLKENQPKHIASLERGADLRTRTEGGGYRTRRQAGELDEDVLPPTGPGQQQKRAHALVGGDAETPPASQPAAPSPTQRFLLERRSLENLRFQSASGYWDNTYVPGDPVLRWLEARLRARDPATLPALSSRPFALDAAARQVVQPFDPPTTSALSVFVHADRSGLEHKGRMLVQVGLRGAERRSRLRQAMNVGVVLDLRGELPAETAASVRALLDALLAARNVGDAFGVTVAGRAGAPDLEPESFRHGTVSVLVRQLFEAADGSSSTETPQLGLVEAVRRAVEATRRVDDPTAPLGSSLVLVVTAQPLGPLTEPLVAIAHESAVGGVPVSAVGIGDRARLDELERVILAGQGNRRLMRAPADAKRVIERELSALSRVIARAVRLRIQLAPGVQLVDVVGSQRLDAAGAGRVRQAEQAIDRRLSRNLGIEADRGEDEQGIQIVIPTFYSGDAHAVLLDVVAPGPGPVADVSVRYKDLVYLRNGVARAHLSMGRSAKPPGPLERNVVKNYLAIRLAETLKRAGRALLAADADRAIALVRAERSLLDSLTRERTGFQNDRDLLTDVAMLDEYLALLDTGASRREDPRQYLAESLQLSGYFKTVPRSPPEAGSGEPTNPTSPRRR